MNKYLGFALAVVAVVAGITSSSIDTVVADKPSLPLIVEIPEPAPQICDPLTKTIVTGPAVLMITDDRCRFCECWWQSHRDDLVAKGWIVEKVVGNYARVKMFPTFRVYDRRKWSEYSGYMSMAELSRIIKK